MPILRPYFMPTAGVPGQVVATNRRNKNMTQPDFYEQQMAKQTKNPVTTPEYNRNNKYSAYQQYDPNTRQDQQYEQPSVSGDYITSMLGKMASRQAPPALEPGSRVRNATKTDPGSFQSYYQMLDSIGRYGQSMLQGEQSKAQARHQAELDRIRSVQSPNVNFNLPGGGAGQSNYNGGGNIGGWINQAASILSQQGINLSQAEKGYLATMIQHESAGNPNAINNWDSNAKNGTPSKGLMQTIDPTFNRWKLPGYNDIYNPVHNILAGYRYSIGRYGSLGNVPGIRAVNSGGNYVGY